MTDTTNATIHPFEIAGLGLAPFRFVGMTENVWAACPGAPEKPGGSCDYCGTGIRYCCHVRSHDGREFVVGCDCVRKLERADNALISAMERAERKLMTEKRQAARAEKWRVAREEREARIAAAEAEQRERNGGMTDRELADRQRAEAESAKRQEMEAVNGWLLKVLDALPYRSEFVDNMRQQLERHPVRELSDRCVEILRDIYAKHHGRRGSKKYDEAAVEFGAKAAGE